MNKLATIICSAVALAAFSSGAAMSFGTGKRLLKTVSNESYNGPPGVSINSLSSLLTNETRTLRCPAKYSKGCMIEVEMTIRWNVQTANGNMGQRMSINGAQSVWAGSVGGFAEGQTVLSHWKFTQFVGTGNQVVRFFAATDTPQYLSGYAITASIYAR
jgi:hypothetical protein